MEILQLLVFEGQLKFQIFDFLFEIVLVIGHLVAFGLERVDLLFLD